MIYYNGIDVSVEIDVNKTSASKEFDIWHHWYFFDKVLKFQLDVYNGCHDVLMMSINLNNIAILNIRGVDYRCTINKIREMRHCKFTGKTLI